MEKPHLIKNNIIPALEKIAEEHNLIFSETYYDPNNKNIYKESYGFQFERKTSKNIVIWFAFADNLKSLKYNLYDISNKKWLGQLISMGKYSDWYWDNPDVSKTLCNKNNDILNEIDKKIVSLLPELDNSF